MWSQQALFVLLSLVPLAASTNLRLGRTNVLLSESSRENETVDNPGLHHFDAGSFQEHTRRFLGESSTNGPYSRIQDDMLFKGSQKPSLLNRKGVDRRGLISTGKRRYFWDVFEQMESCKTQAPLWEQPVAGSGDNRPTLVNAHYIVIPVWWDGEDTSVSFDKAEIEAVLLKTQQEYKDMSYNKHTLTYEVWDQIVLTGVTPTNASWENSKEAARKVVDDAGRVQFQDYTSILLTYNLAREGPFSGAGGWGEVNGDFAWISYIRGADFFEVYRQYVLVSKRNYRH